MSKNKVLWFVSCLVLAALLFSACAPAATEPAPAVEEPAAEAEEPAAEAEEPAEEAEEPAEEAEEPAAEAEEPAAEAEEPAAEPVTIRAIGFESCIMDGLALQAEAYMKENPNVTIELEPTAYTNLHEKQVIELSSGTGTYDIYSIVTDWLPEYTAAGFLEPLDGYVDADPPAEWPNTWTEGFTYIYGADGNLYGFPHHDGPQLLYYRKDLFEDSQNMADFEAEYGYALAPPETWVQFLDIATFFTNPDEDFWGTVLTAKFGEQQLAHDYWFMLPGFGGGTGFDDKGYPTFNDAAGVETIQFYADLINKHKVAPEASVTYGIPEAGDFYLAGKAAMHWNWAHIGAYAELEDTSSIIGKNGFTTMPKNDNGEQAVYASYWVLSLDKNSENKDVAYDFMNFATNEENDKILAEVGCIPSRLSSWNDPDLLAQNPFYAVFQPSYEGFITSSPRFPEYAKLDDLMQRYLSQVIAGDMEAQAAMDAAVEEMTEVLKEAGHIE